MPQLTAVLALLLVAAVIIESIIRRRMNKDIDDFVKILRGLEKPDKQDQGDKKGE